MTDTGRVEWGVTHNCTDFAHTHTQSGRRTSSSRRDPPTVSHHRTGPMVIGCSIRVSYEHHLSSFAQLPRATSPEEKTSLWRQGMTTLARAAQDQQPLPLDGLDPGCLRDAVQVAMGSGLLDELSWLSPAAAAAAVYELASAIPESPERAHLERQAHTLLHQGDAHTFATLATYMAAESHQALHELPVRARVTRAIGLPVTDTSSDPLALTLLARPELRREWLSKPSRGSLPDRRLAAQLVERAARETVRRISQGDGGSLRVFQLGAVRSIWQLLLSDREVLVWRHIAAARGLLANAVPEWRAEIEDQLNPHADTTAFRRAAVSPPAEWRSTRIGQSVTAVCCYAARCCKSTRAWPAR